MVHKLLGPLYGKRYLSQKITFFEYWIGKKQASREKLGVCTLEKLLSRPITYSYWKEEGGKGEKYGPALSNLTNMEKLRELGGEVKESASFS
jgi:hypothetical protein